MQKKRLMSVFLLGLLLAVSLISIIQFSHVVSADPLSDWYTNNIAPAIDRWGVGGGVDQTFAKILMFVLILIIVYSVAGRIPGFSESGNTRPFVWIIAAIVAFLSTAYLTPNDVYAILLSYSGLGVTLAAIVPFFILVLFSYDIISHKSIKNPWVRIWLVRFLWAIFGFWAIYRFLSFDETGTVGATINPIARPTLLIVFLICLAAITFAKTITNVIRTGEEKGVIEGTRTTVRLAAERENAEAEAARSQAG